MPRQKPSATDSLLDTLDGWERLKGYRRYRLDPGEGSNNSIRNFVEDTGLRIQRAESFQLSIRALRFSTHLAAYVKTASFSVVWERPQGPARRRYLFLFVTQGEMVLTGDAIRHESPTSGISIIFPGDESLQMTIRVPTEAMFFSFDAQDVAKMGLTPDTVGDIPRDAPLFRACFAYLRRIVEGESIPGAKDAHAIAAMNQQVAQSLAAAAVTREQMSFIDLARAVISNEYVKERFNADGLAEILNSSRSTVYRAFLAEGTTPSREISRQRTAAARELQEKDPSISLLEVVRRCGFGSVSTLRRALLAE